MTESQDIPLVELARAIDTSLWYGFVVAKSESVTVLHTVSERFDLDGYCAFRCQDVTSVTETFEKRDLLRRALRIRHQMVVVPSAIDASSMRSLMESAQAAFGVLVIEREQLTSEQIEVGTIRMTSEDTYVLRWLSSNAEWDNDDRPFRYRDITKVHFGADYEQTLLAVARSREDEP